MLGKEKFYEERKEPPIWFDPRDQETVKTEQVIFVLDS